MLLEVESVTHDEHIRQLKSPVGDRHINDLGDDPVEELADLEGGGVARLGGSQQVAGTQTRSNDVFDDDDLPPFDTVFRSLRRFTAPELCPLA